MNIFYDKKPFGGFGNLGDTGQHAIGKNVTVDPVITIDAGMIAADRMEKKDSIFIQTAVNNFHK